MPKALTIRSGNVRVRIFASKTTLRTGGPTAPASSPGGEDTGEGGPLTQVALPTPRTYTRHEIRWTDFHGKRRRLKRSSLPEAKREAQRIADDLNRGAAQSELSLADLASFRAAVVNLLGTGKTLELATAEYAELRKLCPDATVAEIGAFYVANRPKSVMDMTTAAAVEQFILWKEQSGLSRRYRQTLKCVLGRFTKDNPCLIGAMTAERVNQWIHSMTASARTKNNHLAAVQSLFTLPALETHFNRAAIRRLLPVRESAPQINLWKPDEFKNLLDTACLPYTAHNKRTRRNETRSHAHLIPVLVLGGFCKVRSAEIARLRWENIRLDDRQFLLEAGQTKNRRMRIVPMPENAVAWLRTIRQTSGKIWPLENSAFHKDLRALAERAGLPWRRNALRKSANTYSMLIDPDLVRVSTEAGNSPAVLEKNYLRFHGITKADAEAWFAILPPMNTRVIVPLDARDTIKKSPQTVPNA